MIKYILFPLLALTLTLSCANTQPELTTESDQQAEPAVSTAPAPTPTQEPTPAVEQTSAKAKSVKKKQATKESRQTTTVVTAEPIAQMTPAAETTPALEITPAAVETPAEQPEPTESLPATELFIAELPATEIATTATGQAGIGQTDIFAQPQPQPPTQKLGELPAKSKQRFLPTRRRMDREINKIKFAYKGEIMMGMTASYGTLSNDDTEFLTVLTDISANGTIASVRPFIGYFYSDNHCVGVRFGYNHVDGTLDNTLFDLGDTNDISFDVPYFDTKSNNYSFGVFHRSYAGLDPKGRFGLFSEIELSVTSGSSSFAYESGDMIRRTNSDNVQLRLSFNPGVAVYIFPNVCGTLSFGLGGIQYTSVTQKDADGNKIGSRKASSMKFKLNVAAINIGMTVHFWDKKKR